MNLDLAIDDQVIINSNFDYALQLIDMLFNTEKCELIGETDYGSNFEYLLWHLNPSTERVKSYIYELLNWVPDLNKYEPQVSVEMIEGEYREIFLIEIKLTYGNSVKYRKYEFR